MRLYLPKLYLILIANIIILPDVILSEINSNTEYDKHYIHSNNLLYPTLYENIEDDTILNDNDIVDYIISKNQHFNDDQTLQPIDNHKYWINELPNHDNDYENEHQERIISSNLIKKLTENLLKQQNAPSSLLSSSSSSSSPGSLSSTSIFRESSLPSLTSARSILRNSRSKNSLHRPYRLKRDDLGWKKRSMHYNV
uniref:Hypotheticial protein n=1 Tax=Schistosoma japonicum TaxID=6182 RepID=C1LNB7_SCHJA|nr:hypotheticial protein [Schistosoma japonicum]